MALRIHVICLALNEEIFISEFLKALYPYVSGISIITQYDRDFYGNQINPDNTVENILSFPDNEGKISTVIRRFRDETAARNHEMLSILNKPHKGIIPHGVELIKINEFYQPPDYFLIADADEIYDSETFPAILEYLDWKKPRGMRITGYNYCYSWNQRVPKSYEHFNQFGFVKPGLLFKNRRWITFNETRLRKQLDKFHLPDFSSNLFGFINCPEAVGVFHHGWFLGDEKRHRMKLSKHSHKNEINIEKFISDLKNVPITLIPNSQLPKNILNGNWPEKFFLNEINQQ